jgi:hypothetical protein
MTSHLALVFAITLFIGQSGTSATSSRLPYWPIAIKIRGGGSTFSLDLQTESSTSSTAWPEIRTSDMAVALRYTAEVNRRLQLATTNAAQYQRNHHRMEELAVRGGYMTSPSPFRIPLYRTNTKETKEISIFDAPMPMSRDLSGIARCVKAMQ